MDTSLYGRFKSWWSAPYNEQMSVPRWFLFFGLTVVLSFLWSMVIDTIKNHLE